MISFYRADHDLRDLEMPGPCGGHAPSSAGGGRSDASWCLRHTRFADSRFDTGTATAMTISRRTTPVVVLQPILFAIAAGIVRRCTAHHRQARLKEAVSPRQPQRHRCCHTRRCCCPCSDGRRFSSCYPPGRRSHCSALSPCRCSHPPLSPCAILLFRLSLGLETLACATWWIGFLFSISFGESFMPSHLLPRCPRL